MHMSRSDLVLVARALRAWDLSAEKRDALVVDLVSITADPAASTGLKHSARKALAAGAGVPAPVRKRQRQRTP